MPTPPRCEESLFDRGLTASTNSPSGLVSPTNLALCVSSSTAGGAEEGVGRSGEISAEARETEGGAARGAEVRGGGTDCDREVRAVDEPRIVVLLIPRTGACSERASEPGADIGLSSLWAL